MLLSTAPQWIENKITRLSQVIGIIGVCVLVAMMLFTVLNVIMRAFFNSPIPGDVELIEVGMVCVGFWGLAWCALRKMHIGVDLVIYYLPRRLRSAIDSIGYIIGLGICLLLTWRGFAEGIINHKMHILSSTLGFPMWPFYWVTAVGYGVFCLAIVVLLVRSLSEMVRK